ncbi:MAG TPA: DegT/DnrJ/EryC1/StrS family aminotransferase [Pseudolabrys sp.]|jgi:dTDP-4-amino-4,6-dideoxygalactose transaminase|nr:DegT/DnrJ/EryC1/StrS family aminotransferase [Pseudolabrys sp.]
MTERAKVTAPSVPFIDLAAQRNRLGRVVDDAIARVLAHGQYVMGPEVRMLEADLAHFCGAKEVISCSNGTDALALILRAKGIKAGDAVFCPSFTFAATAEVVAWFGATPVFIDVFPDTFNMDASSLERGVATAKQLGLNPACVIPVGLFGQPADFDAIEPICAKHKLWILDDAAQSFGATYKTRKIGTVGTATATSFFPAKPLGCYGDGGAIFTDDKELADVLRSLRNHGQGNDKYDNTRIGINGRLDTIQAAILIEKLKIFADEIDKRQVIAKRYNDGLKDVAVVPRVLDGCVSTWAQYTIKISKGRRDAVAAALKEKGIPTAIYYPKPLHQQTAYKQYPSAGNGLPVSDVIAHEVLALPMHPYLAPDLQDRIIQTAREALAA